MWVRPASLRVQHGPHAVSVDHASVQRYHQREMHGADPRHSDGTEGELPRRLWAAVTAAVLAAGIAAAGLLLAFPPACRTSHINEDIDQACVNWVLPFMILVATVLLARVTIKRWKMHRSPLARPGT
jgi:hypothetical protein